MMIADQFNRDQEGVPHRSHTTLMTRYRNKKTRGKKDLADKRMRFFFSEKETKKLIGILEELQPSKYSKSKTTL